MKENQTLKNHTCISFYTPLALGNNILKFPWRVNLYIYLYIVFNSLGEDEIGGKLGCFRFYVWSLEQSKRNT